MEGLRRLPTPAGRTRALPAHGEHHQERHAQGRACHPGKECWQPLALASSFPVSFHMRAIVGYSLTSKGGGRVGVRAQATQKYAIEKKISEEAAKRHVAEMIGNMIASFSSRITRSFEYVMTKILKRLFVSIHVDDQGLRMVRSPHRTQRQRTFASSRTDAVNR